MPDTNFTHPMRKWEDILTIVSGKNQKNVETDNGQYPIYGSGGIIGRANAFLCEAGTTIVGRKGTINSPIYVNERFWNVDTAFGIVPGPELLPKFLYYFCRHFNFKDLDKSTTIPSLAKRDLLAIKMVVPSLPEQERIVARIEELFSELDKAVETLNTTKQQLAVYRQAVLKEALTPQPGWQKTIFSDLLTSVRNGYGKKPDDKGEYRILRISSVRPDRVDLSDFRCNQQPFSSQDLISENDLLFTRYNGSLEYVGVCGCVPVLQEEYAYPDKIIKCTPKINNQYHSRFLQYYLNQGDARKYILSKVKTTSGQKGIAGSDIKRVIVYVPELFVQEAIVKKLDAQLTVCDQIEKTIEQSLQQADALRQSILKQAFEGRL